MALKQNRVDIVIDGTRLTYYRTPSDAELVIKAEQIINDKIQEYRREPNNAKVEYEQFLKAVMVKLVLQLLRSENDAEETLEKLHTMDSEMENYLKEIKVGSELPEELFAKINTKTIPD